MKLGKIVSTIQERKRKSGQIEDGMVVFVFREHSLDHHNSYLLFCKMIMTKSLPCNLFITKIMEMPKSKRNLLQFL